MGMIKQLRLRDWNRAVREGRYVWNVKCGTNEGVKGASQLRVQLTLGPFFPPLRGEVPSVLATFAERVRRGVGSSSAVLLVGPKGPGN